MDYKKMYEDALERAKEMIEHCRKNNLATPKLEQIFPELRESENEKIRKNIIDYFRNERKTTEKEITEFFIPWLEKQGTPQVRTGIEWVNAIDDACDKRYSEEYAEGEYCHEQSFKWGFQEGVDWLEKLGENFQYWKPSEEQLEALDYAFNLCPDTEKGNYYEDVLETLIEDLHRLEKQGEQKQHLELKAGHWYICHRAYCCRADHLTVKEGERFMCEKDGVVKGFVLKEPEKYFKEICAPASMEDEQKPADKIEPKFKVGDWIVKQYLSYPFVIVDIKNDSYILNDIEGNKYEETIDFAHKVFHLWTIQDAEDGDVLKEDSCTFIIERMKPDETAIVHCCLFDDGYFDLIGSTLSFDVDSTYPATKEHCDLLFQKMKEAGYEWDAEKKELRKIEQKHAEWSEEDEEYLQNIVDWIECLIDDEDCGDMSYEEHKNFYMKRINWLKYIKDRVQPQPKQEWSEEGYNFIKELCGLLVSISKNGYVGKYYTVDLVEKLKSLKPNHWKPSEEHLNSLGRFIEGVYGCVDFTNIKSLYNDLKNL